MTISSIKEREIAHQKALDFLLLEIKWGNNTVERLMSSIPARGGGGSSVYIDPSDHRFIIVDIETSRYVFDLQKLFNVAIQKENGQLSML